MERHYKLERLRELADNDNAFILTLVETFLEEVPEDAKHLKEAVVNKNKPQAYQIAHKMKPTIDVFELGVLETLIEIEDWAKSENNDEDVLIQLDKVLLAVESASNEIKADFNL